MNRPNPAAGVASFAGWIALAVVGSVVLLPADPRLTTLAWGTAAVLFAASVAMPHRSLPLGALVLAVAGVSSLALGASTPAVVVVVVEDRVGHRGGPSLAT